MEWQATKLAFWVYLDHFGRLTLLNFGATLACLLIFFLGIQFSGYPTLPLLALLLLFVDVGLVGVLKEMINGPYTLKRTYFRTMRKHAPQVVVLWVVLGALSFSLWSIFGWCVGSGFLNANAAGVAAAAVWWVHVFAGLVVLLAIPALEYKCRGILRAVGTGSVLVLQNPGMALWLGAQVAVIIFLASQFEPVLGLFSMAPLAALQCGVYEMLAQRYGSEVTPAVEDYLERGWRDFWFPWKT